jgi:hypothetical protein
MEMPFEEIALVPPALAGITPLSESTIEEGLASAAHARRQPFLGFLMSMLEAWPQSSGPFFTADGQSATCQAQARGDA